MSSTTNHEGANAMSTTTKTAAPTLNATCITLAEGTPALMPGDTVHVEVTCKVDGVSNYLAYDGSPRTAYTLKELSPAVIRCSVLDGKSTTIPGRITDPEIAEAVEAVAARDRMQRSRIRRLITAVWVLAVALWVVVILSGCAPAGATPEPSPGPAPTAPATVETCTEALTVQLRREMADETTDDPAPAECEGLTDAQIEEALGKAMDTVLTELFSTP